MRIVKEYETVILAYDKGKFDQWCVYEISGETKKALTDANCFQKLKILAKQYGNDKIYQDYVQIYHKTEKEIQKEVLQEIDKIAFTYSEQDQVVVNVLFTEIYMMMISEQNKEKALLGKRIKRLGIHMVLIDHQPIMIATNYSKKKKFEELDRVCKNKGF